MLRIAAGWCVPENGTFGGHLNVTSSQVTWTPTEANRALGAEEWSIPAQTVREVGKSPRTWNLFDGGLRVRLRITTTDGGHHLFVVNSLEDVLCALQPLQARPEP